MMLYLVISGVVLTNLRRPTGPLTVIEQKLEGEFRYINSRLITNSEEVAFYQGNNRYFYFFKIKLRYAYIHILLCNYIFTL